MFAKYRTSSRCLRNDRLLSIGKEAMFSQHWLFVEYHCFWWVETITIPLIFSKHLLFATHLLKCAFWDKRHPIACHMKPNMIYIHWFLVMRTVHNLEDIGLATDQLKNGFKVENTLRSQQMVESALYLWLHRPVGNDAIMLKSCPMLTSADYAQFYAWCPSLASVASKPYIPPTSSADQSLSTPQQHSSAELPFRGPVLDWE